MKKRWEGSRTVGKLRDGEEIRGDVEVEEEAGKGKGEVEWWWVTNEEMEKGSNGFK